MRKSALATATEMVGQKFGRLTVESIVSVEGARIRLACVCECGGTRVARHDHIRAGSTASCGCMHREAMSAKKTHGRTKSAEHITWGNMIARCENERATHYGRYGGRGIRVCERWRSSFANFLADMGPRPTDAHEIDRIDNDGHYEPGNCRWATRTEQMGNTSRSRHIEAGGETLILEEWARRLDVSPDAITMRINRGMSEADAVTKPFRRRTG